MPSTKEIMDDLASGMKPVEVAEKWKVSLPRISNAKRDHELKTLRMEVEEYKRQLMELNQDLKYFHDLVHRKAILAYPDKMTPEEKKKWEAL